jgi:hypothetical protein
MKKILVSLSLIAAISTTTAQVEQGNVIVDTYYGFPNLYTAVFKTTYANAQSNGAQANLNVRGFGPVGIRGEYLVTDKFGIGLDMHYQSSSVDFDEVDNSGATAVTYNYKFKTTKIVIMPSFNFHFLEEEKMDLYLQVAAGYGSRKFSFTSTEPGYSNPTVKGLFPVSFRTAVGYRYFFSDNIGINVALGLGGPLVSGGLSFKF